jgi:hypothetical protein
LSAPAPRVSRRVHTPFHEDHDTLLVSEHRGAVAESAARGSAKDSTLPDPV